MVVKRHIVSLLFFVTPSNYIWCYQACTDKIDMSMHLHFCETFCYEHGMTNQKISTCPVIYIFKQNQAAMQYIKAMMATLHNTSCFINLNIRAHNLGHRKRLFMVLITMYYEPENYPGSLIINKSLLTYKRHLKIFFITSLV